MRPILFIYLLVFLTAPVFGQNNTANASLLLRKKVITPAQITAPPRLHEYDKLTIHHKLRTAKRCIISGSAVVGAGGAVFVAGWITTIPGPAARNAPAYERSDNFLATALVLSGMTVIAVGIPVLTAGLVLRHKWKKIERSNEIHTGILSDHNLGLTMNF